MKIKVTYETEDLRRLIRQDLTRQGIKADMAEVAFAKNAAVVSIEVAGDALTEPVTTVPEPVLPVAPAVSITPTKQTLAVVDGGMQTVDMDEILSKSASLTQRPGRYPTPEHNLMDGETFDFPGVPKR